MTKTPPADIHKAAGMIIDDRKVLIVRAHDSDTFISLSGKLEGSETPIEALKRECLEEVNIQIDIDTTKKLDTFYGTAIGKHAGKSLQIDAYLVGDYEGEIVESSEIAELAWVNSSSHTKYNLAPIFSLKIIPALLKHGLID